MLCCSSCQWPFFSYQDYHMLLLALAGLGLGWSTKGSLGSYLLNCGPSNPSSLVRFLPVSQYLLELASGLWVLECGVLSCRGA